MGLKSQPQAAVNTQLRCDPTNRQQAILLSVPGTCQPGCFLGTGSLLLHMALTSALLPSLGKELSDSCPPPQSQHRTRGGTVVRGLAQAPDT